MNLTQNSNETSDLLKKIFTPLLLCMGTFGNLISIKIFCQPNMKKYTTFRMILLVKFNPFSYTFLLIFHRFSWLVILKRKLII